MKVYNDNNLPTIPITDLLPTQGDLKDLSDKNYKKLKNTIEKRGFSVPVYVWEDSKGIKHLLDGHQRRRVLETEGWNEPIPYLKVPAKDLQEAMARLLEITSQYGTITQEGIDEFISKYELPEADVYEATSFDGLGSYGEDDEVEIEEDEAPEVSSEPPVSQLGSIYQLGKHRVMCGDSTDKANVELLMNGNKADMVFTDPPYGMFLNADFSGMVNKLDFAKEKGFKSGRKYENVSGDHDDFNPDFINVVFENFECKEIFLWGANYYSELLPDRNKGSWIVWDKRLEDSADKMYGSCFELCWSKQKHKQDIARVKWAGVFGTEQEFDRKRHHPTQKPIGLSAWFIERYSKKDWTIADLFLGSGSTLIACEQTDRTCYGMELDPKYVDVIRKRYAKFISPDNELPENWEELTPVVNNEKIT